MALDKDDDAEMGREVLHIDFSQEPPYDDDLDAALNLFVKDARVSSDSIFAASFQQSAVARLISDQQYAQGVNAREIGCALDYEYARRLGEMEEQGNPASNDSDVEQILGVAMVRDFMTQSSSDIRKGKRKEIDEPGSLLEAGPSGDPSNDPSQDVLPSSPKRAKPPNDTNICGICYDPIQLTHSPLKASEPPNTSAILPFGLSLSCPSAHTYCSHCLTTYIRGRIDPNKDGRGSSDAIVFPIMCPQCTAAEWPGGIGEDIANRILGGRDMDLWYQQKLYDDLPKVFCPNPECSQILQEPEDTSIPHAECPSCHRLMCVPCRTTWHGDLTCEQYQAMPLDERSPEDRATLELARTQKWSRCPDCLAMIDLVQGCYHMRCRCGKEFCHRCGSRWKSGKCSSSPPCALWSEEKLLAGQSQMVPVAPVVNAVPVVPRPSVQVAAEPDAHPQPCRVRVDESDEDVYA